MKLFIVGDRDWLVPHGVNEIQEYCNRLFKASLCLVNYGNCLKPFESSLIRTLHGHVKHMLNTMVCSQDGRHETAENAKCLGKESIRTAPLHRCMDEFTVMFKMIRDNNAIKHYFPAACCAYQLFKKCVLTFHEEVCSVYGEGTSGYWEYRMSSIFYSLHQNTCRGRYDSLKSCSVNEPETMKLFNTSRLNVVQQSESPLLVFLDIMAAAAARRRICSMTREEGETCARTVLVIGDRNRIIPHTAEEVLPYCRYVRREFKTSVCTETGRIELANNLLCLDKERVRTQLLHQCMDKFVIMTRMVRNGLGDTVRDLFPAGCCAFQLFRKCVSDFAEEYCSYGYSDSVKGYWNNILTNGFTSVQDICDQQSDSIERCDRNFAPVMALFRNATQRAVTPQLETPLFFFLDVVALY
ncbi:hypothetical protein HDE_13488 [Halotydeus destructor]|nr:hypothetical protein HDE_13488 [Halotydeus destructor]